MRFIAAVSNAIDRVKKLTLLHDKHRMRRSIESARPVEKFSMQLLLGLVLLGFISNAHAWSSLSSLGLKGSATRIRADFRVHPSSRSCPTFLNTAMVSEPRARSSSIDRKSFLAIVIGSAFPAMTMADSTGKFSSKVTQCSVELEFSCIPPPCAYLPKCHCTLCFAIPRRFGP